MSIQASKPTRSKEELHLNIQKACDHTVNLINFEGRALIMLP